MTVRSRRAAGYIPRRVVCLQPSATVTLAALGRLDRIVACTRYCADVCPQVRKGGRKVVADSWTAQSAEILAAQPDLVIASVPYQAEAVQEILKAGIPFIGLAPKSLDDVYSDIALLARVMGAERKGAQVVAKMKKEIAAMRAKTARRRGRRPRVFCEEWGKPIIRSQRWVAELVEAAGSEFLGEPGKQTDAESVRRADPDVLIAAWCGAGDRVPLEKMVAQRGWQEVGAVRAGRVYCIRDEFLNTPAPTLLAGLKALASAIRPDLFPRAKGLRRIAQAGARPAK